MALENAQLKGSGHKNIWRVGRHCNAEYVSIRLARKMPRNPPTTFAQTGMLLSCGWFSNVSAYTHYHTVCIFSKLIHMSELCCSFLPHNPSCIYFGFYCHSVLLRHPKQFFNLWYMNIPKKLNFAFVLNYIRQ